MMFSPSPRAARMQNEANTRGATITSVPNVVCLAGDLRVVGPIVLFVDGEGPGEVVLCSGVVLARQKAHAVIVRHRCDARVALAVDLLVDLEREPEVFGRACQVA